MISHNRRQLKLQQTRLLTLRPVGRQSYYGLAHDVRDLLASTERLLARTGVEVALCPDRPVTAGG